jgi:hypothetical protein
LPAIHLNPKIDGVAFTGEGKLISKGNWLRRGKAEAAPSHIGFAGCTSRASGAHWNFSDEAKRSWLGIEHDPAQRGHHRAISQAPW